MWIEDDEGAPRPGWKTRRAAGSCEAGGWTCTTSPSASMLAAIIRSSPTKAACGLLLLMFHKPIARATEQHRQALREAGFPLPGDAKQTANRDAKKRSELASKDATNEHNSN